MPGPGAVPVPRPAAPAGAEGGAAAADPRPKRSHDKLIEKLRTKYPELTHTDGARYINILRDQNNGKLSGLSIPNIQERVGALMRQDRAARAGGVHPVVPQEESNCSICFDEMLDLNSRRLNPCGHRYHNHCINDWMATSGGAGNTCPMCRHYIVQEEEYPDLGHNPHRRH